MSEHFTVPSSLDDILYTLGHSLSYALIWPNLLYATAVISGKILVVLVVVIFTQLCGIPVCLALVLELVLVFAISI